MNKLRALNFITLFLTLGLFLIFLAKAVMTTHEVDQTLFPFYLTLAFLFLLIAIGVVLEIMNKKGALQIIVDIAVVAMAVVNLIISPRETFNIIFNSLITIIYSTEFSLHVIQTSILRVKEKVDLSQMKPIIKP